MKIGKLEIEGTLDSSGITTSLSRIEESLRGTASQTKTTLGPMTRLGNELNSALKNVTLLGIAGVGAMTALATKAPAVAPAIARMGIEMMKISHTMGEILRPIFEEVADNLIPAIGDAIERNKDKIQSFIDVGVTGVKDLSSALSGDLSQIENLFEKTGMMAIGAAAGYALLGPPGLFLGAALGYAAGAVEPSETRATQDLGMEKHLMETGNLQEYLGQIESTAPGVLGGVISVSKTIASSVVKLIFHEIKRMTGIELEYAQIDAQGEVEV